MASRLALLSLSLVVVVVVVRGDWMFFFLTIMSPPLRVCVTGAAGQIGYSLVFQLGQGAVFGPDQPITLLLLDIEPCMAVLQGVVMELHDCALPLLHDVVATSDPMVAFKDADAVFLVGAMPRREGMERKDLLAANVKIFKAQGEALDKSAKKSVKVLVVGNPANTNALICSRFAPSIPAVNFSAMTRLDQNRAQSQIASRLHLPISAVTNCIIWGNHSSTQFPDVAHAKARLESGEVSVQQAVGDGEYLKGDFITTVQKRGAAIIAARKLSSAMSAAKAACDHMRDWFRGTAPGQYVSMAVISDGSYNTTAGVFYSFPVTIVDGKWSIVQGLAVDDFARERMKVTDAELCAERDEAVAACSA